MLSNRSGELQVLPYPLCQPVGNYCCAKKDAEQNDFAKYGVGVVLYFRFLVSLPPWHARVRKNILYDVYHIYYSNHAMHEGWHVDSETY